MDRQYFICTVILIRGGNFSTPSSTPFLTKPQRSCRLNYPVVDLYPFTVLSFMDHIVGRVYYCSSFPLSLKDEGCFLAS
jgi:hypothetical protein